METMGLEKGAPERGILGHRCGDKIAKMGAGHCLEREKEEQY